MEMLEKRKFLISTVIALVGVGASIFFGFLPQKDTPIVDTVDVKQTMVGGGVQVGGDVKGDVTVNGK